MNIWICGLPFCVVIYTSYSHIDHGDMLYSAWWMQVCMIAAVLSLSILRWHHALLKLMISVVLYHHHHHPRLSLSSQPPLFRQTRRHRRSRWYPRFSAVGRSSHDCTQHTRWVWMCCWVWLWRWELTRMHAGNTSLGAQSLLIHVADYSLKFELNQSCRIWLQRTFQ